jgi:hypothetical protein
MTFSPDPNFTSSAATNIWLERLAYRIFNYIMNNHFELCHLVEGGGCETLARHLGVPLRMVYAVEADVAGMVRSAEAAFWWGWPSPYVNPDGTLAVGP